MRFSIIATTLTGASALMIPSPRTVNDQVETREAVIEERAVVSALIMAAATAAVGEVAIQAVDAAIELVQDLADCRFPIPPSVLYSSEQARPVWLKRDNRDQRSRGVHTKGHGSDVV
jgi:hypothetical protein